LIINGTKEKRNQVQPCELAPHRGENPEKSDGEGVRVYARENGPKARIQLLAREAREIGWFPTAGERKKN